MSERDVAAVLRVRAAGIKEAARTTYDEQLRDVMWRTAFAFTEAADEIEALRRRIAELEQGQ